MTELDNTEPDLFGDSLQLPKPKPSSVKKPSATSSPVSSTEKNSDAFKTISETADLLALPQHVLRFWESKFTQIKPLKLKGGRRYYRPQDIDTLLAIKQLLYKEGYTIKGARRAISQAKRNKKPLGVPGRTVAPTMATVKVNPVLEAKSQAQREELEDIHSELLKLKKMIGELPTLETTLQ